MKPSIRQQVPSSITKHPLWDELWEYIDLAPARDAKGRSARLRIEVKPLPYTLAIKALEMWVQCSKCKKPHHPVRARKAPAPRNESVRGLYYGATCPRSSVKIKMLVKNHELRMQEDVRPEDKVQHELNSLRSFYNAVKCLREQDSCSKGDQASAEYSLIESDIMRRRAECE